LLLLKGGTMNKNKCNLIIALFTLIIVISGCAGKKMIQPTSSAEDRDNAEILVDKGSDYFLQERYELAINTWEEVLKTLPDDEQIHNYIGRAYSKLGDYDRAVSWFTTAVEIDQLYYEAIFNLGVMYFVKSEYESALKYFEQCLKVNPDHQLSKRNYDVTKRLLAGEIDPKAFELYQTAGEVKNAKKQIELYQQILTIDPNYSEVYNNLGVALYYEGRLDESVIVVKKSLDLKPNYAEAHNNLAFIYEFLGEYELAVRHYLAAIKLKPAYTLAMNNLGNTYYKMKQYKNSQKVWKKTLEIDPENKEAKKHLFDLEKVYKTEK